MMKTQEGIPIPTQIIQLIGEKNVADIYSGESSGEDSDVIVWNTNVNTFKLSSKDKKSKRALIHRHLRTLHSYYLAEEQKKAQKAAGGEKKRIVRGVESGYDSKDIVSSDEVLKRKSAMQRASPSSQPDMFSTRSPSKAGIASKPKKKMAHRQSTSNKGHLLKRETSSSDDEFGGESHLPNEHIKTPVQQQNPSSKSKFARSDASEHKKSSTRNSDQSSESDSTSNSSNSGSEKTSQLTTKKTGSNIASSGTSVGNSSLQETLRQTSITDDGSRTSSSDSDHEIIPATQDLSQRSTSMSLLGAGVDNTKSSTLASPLKPLGRQDGNHSAKIMIKSGKTSHQSSESSKRRSHSSNTSDSELDGVPQKALHVNNSSSGVHPIPRKTESSCDSDSSDGSHAKVKEEIPLEGRVLTRHSSDSEGSDGQRSNDSPRTATTKPTKKEITSSSSNTTDSEDDEATEPALLINKPLLSRSPVPQKTESSSDSDSSNVNLKNNKENPSDGVVSKSTPPSSDSEDSDNSRKNGSQCSAPSKPTKNETVSSNSSDSEYDNAPKKALRMNNPLPSHSTPRKTDAGRGRTSCSEDNKKIRSKLIPRRGDSEDCDNASDSGSSSSAPTKPTVKTGSQSSLLDIEKNADQSSRNSSRTSESDNSDQSVSRKSASLTKNRNISPRGKEKNRKTSSSDASCDDKPQKLSMKRLPVSLSNNSRKRKVDTVSSSDDSDSEPKIKVRKTPGRSENVPFNSTRNPEDDEAGFPGSDLSVIPKIKEPTSSSAAISIVSKSKDTGSHMPKTAQLSIKEFAKPINPVSQIGSLSAYESLKQEYYNSGFSNFKVPDDCDSYDGLLEEDLLEKDVEVYVVQCPKEVDPTSLVGQEIDVSENESVVDLSLIGGSKVRHDVCCELSDSDVSVNVVVPSRTKKKFTLHSVPVSGRLTIVESVDVPSIEEFDSSSPPPVPFPENLKARNTFVGSDESSAQLIVNKSIKLESNDEGRGHHEVGSAILDTSKASKFVCPTPEKIESRNIKRLKDHGKLGGSLPYEGVEETKHSGKEDDSYKSEDGGKKSRKAKRKLEENNDEGPNLTEQTEPPTGISSEESLDKKKKKKKKKMHEYAESSETEPVVKGEFVLPPAISIPPVEEPTFEKKKKKKKPESDDLNESFTSASEEVLPSTVAEEPTSERKKKKKKERELELMNDVPVEPTVSKKKKKKKKHESEKMDDVFNSDENQIMEKKKKKHKKEKHLDKFD